MTQQDLAQRLNEINIERNKIIQLLKKQGKPRITEPPFDIGQEYNKLAPTLIGKCGIKRNSYGIHVFQIETASLISSQINLYCNFIFISTSRNTPTVMYCSEYQRKKPLFISKIFNENSGSFGNDWLNDIKWIEPCTYRNLTKIDIELKQLSEDLDIARQRYNKKNEEVSTMTIKDVETELES